MASSVIGALRVSLGIDSAQFSKGLKGAESGLKRFAANMAKAMAAVGAAVAAAATAVGVAVRKTINEADKMGKMAQQIGIPVEELSRLKHAAELSGTSLDGLSTAVGRLSRNMNDVAQGAGAEARRAFDQLGVSVTDADGKLKSSSQVMTEIAGRFAGMEDGAGKTALAMQLMGRSGANMVPMLNQGATGLNAMMQEADQLGIVITEKTARAAAEFNDNLDRLRKVFTGIITQLAEHLLPHLQQLSEAMLNTARDSEYLSRVGETLSEWLRNVVAIGMRVAGTFRGISAEIAGLAEAIGRLKEGDFAGAMDAWNKGQQEFLRINEDVEAAIERMNAATRVGIKGDRLDIPLAKAKPALEEVEDAADKAAGGIARAGAAAKSTATDFSSFQRSGQQLGQTLASSFSGMFDSMVEGTFKAKEAIAGLLKDLSRLMMNQAFTSLFGGGGGTAGTGLFGKLFGFAQGGSFTVGGSGGIDSQLVAFKASPNETVDIRKPGQDNGGTGFTVAPVYNIDARGSDQGVDMKIRAALAENNRMLPGLIQNARSRGRIG